MKKSTLLLSMAIFLFCDMFAQSWLTTGNVVTGTEVLGTTNNKALDIVTSNVTRIKINAKGNVGIGQTTIPLSDRLNVKISVPVNATGLYSMTRGIYSEAIGNAGSTTLSPGVGVYGKCVGNNGYGYGGYFEGDLAGVQGYGLYGVIGISAQFEVNAIGLRGYAESTDGIATGVDGEAASDEAQYNYGVQGSAQNAYLFNVGVLALHNGGAGTAGYFDGDIEYVGSLIDVSDAKFKSNVEPLMGALDKINKLQPRTYDLLTEEYAGMNFGRSNEFGFIAQEIELIFPELVKHCIAPVNVHDMNDDPSKTPFEYKAVNYVGLIPVLTGAIQEQQAIIDEQDKQIADQQKQIDDLNKRLIMIESKIAVNATGSLSSDKLQLATLEQNAPNPFNGQTIINYNIPFQFSGATITLSDLEGRVIATHPIIYKGEGSWSINKNSLSPGTYIYNLTIDNVVADSKTMVFTY